MFKVSLIRKRRVGEERKKREGEEEKKQRKGGGGRQRWRGKKWVAVGVGCAAQEINKRKKNYFLC